MISTVTPKGRNPRRSMPIRLWLSLLLWLGFHVAASAQSNPTTLCTGDICTNVYTLDGLVPDVAISGIYRDSSILNQSTYSLRSGTEMRRVAMKVDVNDLPGGAAFFEMHLLLQRIGTTNVPVGKIMVAPITEAWSPNALNWHDSIAYDTSRIVYGIEGNDKVSINLTDMATSWLSNPASNHGFMILLDYAQEGEYNLASADYADANLRPELEVVYDEVVEYDDSGLYQMDRTAYQSNNLFGNLDFGILGEINPRILMEKSLLGFEADDHDGDGANDASDVGEWNNILRTLLGGVIDINLSIPDPYALANALNPTYDAGKLPVMVIDHDYHHFDPDALKDSLLLYQNGSFLDKLPRARSPYLPERAFAVAAYVEQIQADGSGNIVVHIPDAAFITDDPNRGVQWYIDNQAPQALVTGTDFVVPAAEGPHTLTIEIPGQKKATTQFYVRAANALSSQFTVTPGADFGDEWSITDNLTGEKVAKVEVWPGISCGIDVLDKPFIIVEGFDIFSHGDPQSYYNKLLLQRGDTDPDAGIDEEWLVNALERAGYDLMIVDLNTNWQRIQDNAAILEALLDKVNEVKTGYYQNNLMGFSMGGLISRYALRTMEMNGKNHDVANYFSYDSPHQGAYFPLGMLQFLKSWVNDWRVPFTDFRPLEHAWLIGDLYNAYESPASTQMSVVRAKYQDEPAAAGSMLDGLVDPLRINFYTELGAMGMPTQSRNFGISNGARNGYLQQKLGIGDTDLLPSQPLLRLDIDVKGYLKYHADVTALPAHGTAGVTLDYYYSTGILKKVFPEYAAIMPDITLKSYKYQTDGSLYPYEGMPGGYVEGTGGNIMSYISLINYITPLPIDNYGVGQICFVPTVSALALTDQGFDSSSFFQSKNMAHEYASDEELSGISMFDKVITDEVNGSPANRMHIEGVSRRFAEFIMDAVFTRDLDTVGHSIDDIWTNMDVVKDDILWSYIDINGNTEDPANITYTAPDLFWEAQGSNYHELILGESQGDQIYIKYDENSFNLLVGNMCDSLLYGFYNSQELVTNPTVDHFESVIEGLMIYHGERGAPLALGLDFTNNAQVESSPGKTTSIIGRFTNDTKTAIQYFGDLSQYNFREKPNGFNMLNVTKAHGEIAKIGAGFYAELNDPWLTAAMGRSDVIWAVSDRNKLSEIYNLGDFTGEGRIAEQMTFFGREVDQLEATGWRYTSNGQFVKLETGHACGTPYHVMDYTNDLVFPPANPHTHDLVVTDQDIDDLVNQRAQCGLDSLGELTLLRASITLKTGSTVTVQLMSTDNANDAGIADCNGYLYVSSDMVPTNYFDLEDNTGCGVDTKHTAPVKLLEYLHSYINTNISTEAIDYCGEIEMLGMGLNCAATDYVVNQFRAAHPELLVHNRTGEMYLFPPAAPTNLRIVSVAPEYAVLAWDDNSENEWGFEFFDRPIGDAGWGDTLYSVGADITQDTIWGLTPDTGYEIMMQAVGDAGHSSPSNIITLTTPTGLPGAPTNLVVDSIDVEYVVISWTDNATDEWGFEVEGKLSSGNTWDLSTFADTDETTIDLWGMTPGESYDIRVRAVNDYGPSEWSNVVSVTTNDGRPEAPTNLQLVDVNAEYAVVSWVDNSDSEWGFYYFLRSPGDPDWGTSVSSTGQDVTQDTVWGLDPSTTYEFMLTARGDYGDSDPSNTLTFTTTDGTPVAPSNLRLVSVAVDSAIVAWDDNSTDEWYFEVDGREVGTSTWTVMGYGDPDEEVGTIWGISAAKIYEFRVRAINDYGSSAPSNIITVSTPDGLPNAPYNLRLSNVNGWSATLDWDFVNTNGNEVWVFELLGRPAGTSTWTMSTTTGENQRSETMWSLSAGTYYEFAVRAVNGNGNSPLSNIVFVVTPTGGLVAPQNLTADNITTSSIRLNWTDLSSNETGYRISGRVAGTTTWNISIDINSANVTSGTVYSLLPGTRYEFRVEAFNGAQVSGYSNIVTATTLCPTPGAITFSGISSSTATIHWPAQTGISEYMIQYKPSAGAVWQSANATGTSYGLTGLSDGTSYDVRISARCPNAGIYSAFGSTSTFGTPCLTPSGLTVGAVYSSTATLSWTGIGGADRYEIQYRLSGASAWSSAVSMGTGTSYTLTGLQPGSSYEAKVRGYCTVFGNWTGVTPTITLNTACTTPTGLSATAVGEDFVGLQWGSSAGADRYEIHYRFSGQVNWNTKTSMGTGTSYTLGGLYFGQDYEVKVRAWCPSVSGYTGFTATMNVSTKCPQSSITSVTNTTTTATVNWTGPYTPGTYRIRYRTDHEINWTSVDVPDNSGSYILQGLSPETNYEVEVRTYCPGSGAWSPSSGITYFTTDPPAPLAPTNLWVTYHADREVTVAWTDNSHNEDGFLVQARPTGGGYNWDEFEVTAPENATSATVNYLQPGTEYEFRVRAFNVTGNSLSSNITSITTLCAFSDDLAATNVQHSSATIQWSSIPGVSLYKVYWVKEGETTESSSPDMTGTSYDLTQLDEFRNYNYRLEGYCGGNWQMLSQVESFTTECIPTPSNLRIEELSQNHAVIGFTFPARMWISYERFQYAYCEAESPNYCFSEAYNDFNLGDEFAFAITNGIYPGTRYKVKVRAQSRCTGDWTTWSSDLIFSTPCIPPTGLFASNISYNAATVNWDEQTAASWYQVQYIRTGPASTTTVGAEESGEAGDVQQSGAEMVTVGWDDALTTAESFRLTGLQYNSRYEYQVRAYCGGGYTDWSPVQSFNTLDVCDMPGGLNYTITGSSAILSWSPVSGVSTYTLQYKPSTSSTWSSFNTAYTSASISISQCNTYQFRVRSNCSVGFITPFTNTVSFNAPCSPPGAPRNPLIYLNTANGTANLTWSHPSSGGPVSYYRIYRDGVWIKDVSATTTSYSVPFSCGVIKFYVKAVNSAGSASSSVDTREYRVCPPNLYSATLSGSYVYLKWTDNSNNESGFIIRDQYNNYLGSVGANATSATISHGCNYGRYYQIEAYKSGVSSGYSNSKYIYRGCPPSAPYSLSASIYGSYLRLSWPDVANETGYYVIRNGVNLGYLPANTTYMDVYIGSMVCGSYNNFNVYAYNGYGQSGASPTYMYARTVPSTPSGVTASYAGYGSVKLQWNYSSNATLYTAQRSADNYSWGGNNTTGANTATMTGMTTYRQYYFRVQAYNSSSQCYSGYGTTSYFVLRDDGGAPDGPELDLETAKLQVYPNPMNDGQATLSVDGLIGQGQLKIFDLMGKRVLEKSIDLTQGLSEIPIDLKNEPSGIYLIHLEINGEVHQLKITR